MSSDPIGDLALQDAPRGPELFFFRKLRRGEKRGAGVPVNRYRERAANDREIVATLTCLEVGPDYADKLSYSIKDFARGAFKRLPGIETNEPFFSACSEALTAAEVKRACVSDPAVYRLMVNPLDGERVVSREWFKKFMGKVQVAIGTRLFWFAAIHHHPTMLREANRHVHAFIRGQGLNGEVITFNANFARYGFATIATRMITEELGPLDAAGIARREVEKAEMAERRAAMEMQRKIVKLRKSGVDEWMLRGISGYVEPCR